MMEIRAREDAGGGVSAVILAGGVSRRLGRDKALEPFAGEALIRRVFGRMRRVAERVVVVVNDERRAEALRLHLPADVAFAVDEFPNKGSLGGVFSGLNAAGTEWAVFCACDMPFVNPEVYRLLLSKREGCDAVVPVVDGWPEPVHAAYSRKCLEAMRDKILANRLKIAGFFDDVSVRLVDEDEIRERDPRLLSFFNINTEDDLRTARRLAADEERRA